MGAEARQGNFLEDVMCTVRSGRIGMGHLDTEGSDALGRVNSMCDDPEARRRGVLENQETPWSVGLLPLGLVPTLGRNKMTPRWELAKLQIKCPWDNQL